MPEHSDKLRDLTHWLLARDGVGFGASDLFFAYAAMRAARRCPQRRRNDAKKPAEQRGAARQLVLRCVSAGPQPPPGHGHTPVASPLLRRSRGKPVQA